MASLHQFVERNLRNVELSWSPRPKPEAPLIHRQCAGCGYWPPESEFEEPFRCRACVQQGRKARIQTLEFKAAQSQWRSEERRANPQKMISSNLRSRLSTAVRNLQQGRTGSAVKDLGCTLSELQDYLELKFQPGMTWHNYGLKGWHIDHVRPLNSFDLTDRRQLLQAVHYTNLQPLWSKENVSKNAKWPCGGCGIRRNVTKNGNCRTCNEAQGIRCCRRCREMLPLLSFLLNRSTCDQCSKRSGRGRPKTNLPEREAAILVLRYKDDRSIRDIAALLGLSIGTVHRTLARNR